MKKPKASMEETEIAAAMVQWLSDGGWEVFQEVNDCDIVARKGKMIWAIEAKRTLNDNVIYQAQRRAGNANMVSVVVQYEHGSLSGIKQYYCEQHGIGIFTVRTEVSGKYVYSVERDPDGDGAKTREWVETRTVVVEHLMQPKLVRRRTDRLEKVLCEEMKTYAAAGSPCNCGWTPFKSTCKNLLIAVKTMGEGVTLKEAMKTVKHHYSSERSVLGSMRQNLERGFVPWLRIEDGKLYFRPDEVEKPRSEPIRSLDEYVSKLEG